MKVWRSTPIYLITRSGRDEATYVLYLGLRGYRSRVQVDGSKGYLRTDGRQALQHVLHLRDLIPRLEVDYPEHEAQRVDHNLVTGEDRVLR